MDHRLYAAATSGDVLRLFRVIKTDEQVLLSKPPHGNTALHIAATLGHDNFAREIIHRCTRLLKTKNHQGNTPLHCAAKAGRLEVVRILIQHALSSSTSQEEANGVILRMKNKEGNTAVHEALMNQHVDEAIILLDSDPELAFIANNERESPLHLAVRDGLQKVVAKMLGISPPNGNAIESNGIGAISDTRKRDLIVMKDKAGRTPLHFAVWKNDVVTVDMLLRMDPCIVPFSTDNEGFSPIHAAAAFGSQEVISKLLEHCPDAIEQLDRHGRNALHIAVLNGNMQTISALLTIPNAEQKLNEQDQDGNTPLHLVAANKPDVQSSVIQELATDTGADLSLMNKAGRTAGELYVNGYVHHPNIYLSTIGRLPRELVCSCHEDLFQIWK